MNEFIMREFSNKCKELINSENVSILLSDSEVDFLANDLVSVEKKKYLEIGSYEGGSAFIVGLSMKKLGKETNMEESEFEIMCIDTFKSSSEEFSDRGKSTFEKFQNGISKLNLGDIIRYRVGRSEDICNEIQDGYYDIIFIDGDHTYEGVKQDYENYVKKLKPGGQLMFHDYKMAPGVSDFCNEMNSSVGGDKLVDFKHTIFGFIL